VTTIQTASSGNDRAGPSVGSEFDEVSNGVGVSQKLAILTPRERDIASLVGRGLSNELIAKRLGVRLRTVKNRLTVIFHKVGVRSRVQLALWIRRRTAR
jgi:two-component system, NarL family, response regulator DegU